MPHYGELFDVVDDRHLLYNGEPWAMTALAKELLQAKWSLAGPKYFKYKGEWLNDVPHRCEE